MDALITFLTSVSLLEIVLIFSSKVIEVTISTVRSILMTKGYRTVSALLAFVEILLWVFVASSVINGVQDQPLKGIIYALGFSVGVYCGSVVENKLAFGKNMVQVIIDKEDEAQIVTMLREKKYAVTHFDARGKDSQKAILMVMMNRRGKEKLVSAVYEINPKAVIFSNDATPLHGGYIHGSRSILK